MKNWPNLDNIQINYSHTEVQEENKLLDGRKCPKDSLYDFFFFHESLQKGLEQGLKLHVINRYDFGKTLCI